MYIQARTQDFSQGGVRFNKILLYAREARIKYFLARAVFFYPSLGHIYPPLREGLETFFHATSILNIQYLISSV